MKKGLYAGSFDPVTNGHLWVIKEALKVFDEILIVIGNNPSKKYLFSLEVRKKFLEECFKDEKKVKIKAMENVYIAELAQRENIYFLIRGIRNSQDFEYEKTTLRLNQSINPDIQSIYLMPPSYLNEISSSNVKSLVNFPGWKMVTESMVPPIVNQYFQINLYESLLRPYWNTLMIPSEKWWNLILHNYSEPQRYYHTLEHISELLKPIKDFQLNLAEYQILVLSIFFHDLVYNPQSNQNEEDSLKLFLDFSQEVNLHEEISQRVQEFIIATKTHINSNNDPLLDLFLDLDLSILGADPLRFERYEKEIKKEFSFVPRDIYILERSKIMKKFKNNPFKSEWGKTLSILARKNLEIY